MQALDLRARAFLTWLRLVGWPSLAERTPAQARRDFRLLTALTSRTPSGVRVRYGSIPGSAGRLPVRRYTPRTGRAPRPLLVWFHGGGFVVGDLFDDTGNVPPATLLRAFQMLRPLGDLAGYVTLWDRLDDRRTAQAIWALTDWAHDHVPFPGAAFVEMIRSLSRENALLTGEVVLAGRPRRLADITCPFLNVYGTHDHVTPPASVAPLGEQVGSERNDTLVVRSGHIGLLVGGSARKQTLPKMTEWLASVEATP